MKLTLMTLLTLLVACGDKEEDTSTEAVEDTTESQPSSEHSTEDTSSEQPADTATSTEEA